MELPGLASRTRLSSDGRYAATTTFVHGDSYADSGFSTRTSIIDMKTGSVIVDLEKLAVTKDGESFQSVDFNFWGVTFVKNSQRFYATLGTAGETYLVEGNVGAGTARVLRTGVECPSLSPDGTRIAFKKRNPGTVVTWGISVLDLATLKDHPLAETRNVDDQVEWLDDQTVIYGLPQDAGEVNAVAERHREHPSSAGRRRSRPTPGRYAPTVVGLRRSSSRARGPPSPSELDRWALRVLIPRPPPCKGGALPTELNARAASRYKVSNPSEQVSFRCRQDTSNDTCSGWVVLTAADRGSLGTGGTVPRRVVTPARHLR